MNGENVKKWRLLFEDGMTNVHEEQRSGRSFFGTENLKEADNAEPEKSRRFTISELQENFPAVFRCPNYQVVTERLHSRNTTQITAVNSEPTPRNVDASSLLRRNAAPRTRALPEYFKWQSFENPPYSPDLGSSDYHFFSANQEIFVQPESEEGPGDKRRSP
jgi:hypothetical protein